MIPATFRKSISYPAFLRELKALLYNTGIAPSHQAITAQIAPPKNKIGTSQETRPIIGSVIFYIEEHLTEQLSLEKMAEEVQLSKYQLIRRFRDEQGATPWQYLIEKRVEKARELLEQGMAPGQVAVETGFYDQSHMHRTFLKETGKTPKEYQEQHFKDRN